MTNGFLRECLQQLDDLNFCYVYTILQVEEVMKKYNKKLVYEPNECGYTIKVVRKGAKKDE